MNTSYRRILGMGKGSRRGQATTVGLAVFALIVLFTLWQVWQWFFCRIEIEPGMVGILIAKMGKDLPPGEIIAPDSSYKGIRMLPLAEGRHFFDPIIWDWEIHPMIEIPNKHLGVCLRFYGKDFSDEELRAGKVIAEEGEKGLQREVKMPGRYRVNKYAEAVEIHPAVEIPAGFVGVVTWFGGTDKPLASGAAPDLPAPRPATASGPAPEYANASEFLVEPGRKGVSREVLTPGVHYLNPYVTKVTLMDCRSQRFELAGNDALLFPSSDAFDMTVLMTVEWAIDPARAPEIFVRIGELDADPEKNEILQKVLIPAIRGFGRIEGSKYTALDYISGNSRQAFQNTLFEKIKDTCEPKGILIKSVLINDIEPPQEIATPIREREIAKEELNRNKTQLLQAQAEQSLARSEEMVKLERERVAASTKNKVKIIDATNQRKVALINQDRRLQMEATFLEASRREAEAILSRGQAEADVVLLKAEAEAKAIEKSIAAFKTADNAAYFEFVSRVAPAMHSIFANTEGVFGRIFQGIVTPRRDDKGGN
ncbi:MAG: hypothetical protein GX442_06595 [Candidatus Riflebacteria bacterium]|nr:hypothetical protein [Candidatus Riflebacteria bacterium]